MPSGYIVCFIKHIPKDNLTRRIYYEHIEFFGKDNAGWPLRVFEMGSVKIVRSLVALGVLRIDNEHWYLADFGQKECGFYLMGNDDLSIHIPIE